MASKRAVVTGATNRMLLGIAGAGEPVTATSQELGVGAMKLVVIGGTGLVGSQVVRKLTAAGHEAVPAALETGVDLISGQGLDQALAGAAVVINVANSPTFDEAALDFFRTSMGNVLGAESAPVSGTR